MNVEKKRNWGDTQYGNREIQQNFVVKDNENILKKQDWGLQAEREEDT